MNRGHTNSISSSQNPTSAFQTQARTRNDFGSASDKAVPVPGSAVMYRNGVDRKSSIGGNGTPLFDLARSPPNHPSNKSELSPGPLALAVPSTDISRYKACALQVLSSRRLSGRYCLPLLSFNGPHEPASTLQVFHEGIVYHYNSVLMPITY